MQSEFADLRRCIFATKEELRRFRQVIVNVVLATDIFDKVCTDGWGALSSGLDILAPVRELCGLISSLLSVLWRASLQTGAQRLAQSPLEQGILPGNGGHFKDF